MLRHHWSLPCGARLVGTWPTISWNALSLLLLLSIDIINVFICYVVQSHASQQQCGLTSPAADRLVGQVQKAALLHMPGEFPKLYGASSVGHADSGRLSVLTCIYLHWFSSRIAPRIFL